MDLTFLNDYFVFVVVGICLCVGFVIKKIEKIPNNYIPLIMAILGATINFWANGLKISPDILLGGMFSGLASTGLHQMFKQIIEIDDEEEGE